MDLERLTRLEKAVPMLHLTSDTSYYRNCTIESIMRLEALQKSHRQKKVKHGVFAGSDP